jgi:hypothetical protein
MHSPKILQTFREQAAAATAKLEKLVLTLETQVKAIEEDGGLPPAQREFKVKAARAAVEGQVVELVRQVHDVSASVATQRRFWSSPALVLAQQKFGELPSIDAQIKSWHASRLARLPLPALSLEYEHALATGEFALLGLILTERSSRNVPVGDLNATDFSLEGVAIPGQAEALGALEGVDADLKYAEHLFKESRGTRVSAAEKMARARLNPERKANALEPHAVSITTSEGSAAARAAANAPGLAE